MTTAKIRTRLLGGAAAMTAIASMATPAIARAETVYSFADVQKHASEQDCWTVVNGGVYDLTAFIPRHEGGRRVIIALCGIDGTASYDGQHGRSSGGENEPARALAHYRIGALDPSTVPTATKPYTAADVSAHHTTGDCWSIVNGKVYNLTAWIPKHPAGPDRVAAMCGIDGSTLFNGQHKGSASANAVLNSYVIGTVAGSSATPVTTSPNTTKLYTITQVRKHATAADCWTVIHRRVYDLTAWIPLHPGGKATIVDRCGKRGAQVFNAQHGGSAPVASTLATYQIGRIA